MANITIDADLRASGLDLSPAKVLSLGLGVAVALWILWFALHLPGLALPPVVVGPAVLVGWTLFAGVGARMVRPGLAGAAAAGFVTALVGLAAFGAILVEQPDPARFAEGRVPLRPAAGLLTLGFLLTGTVLGLVSAVAAGAAARRPSLPSAIDDPWPARLAAVVAASFLPLVMLGGAVTSTESGMAVPGWPDTFGANMFLYPVSLMSQPRIYLEHSHRLFGTLAGICTVGLWLVVMLGPTTRRRYGIWVTALLVTVIIQGILGAQRVVLNNPFLGAVHGAVGQVVLAFAATLALWMTPRYRHLRSLEGLRTRPLRVFTTAALHISIAQLVLGALFRHLRRDGSEGAWHVIFTHIGLSFIVVALAILAGAVLMRFVREHGDRIRPVAGQIRGIAIGIHAVIGLQFLLGWIAFLAVLSADRREGVPTWEQLSDATPVPLSEAITATLHQFNGAIYLLLVMLAWAWARRLHRASTG